MPTILRRLLGKPDKNKTAAASWQQYLPIDR